MNTTTKKFLNTFAASLLFISASTAFVATPAMAYDDDVDFVCGDTDDGDTWCVSVDDLKAECPLTDPEYTTDECQGLLEDERPTGGRFVGFGKSLKIGR